MAKKDDTKSTVITIDGKEYKTEDMSAEQQYAITQIKNLQGKSASLKFDLDQIQRAQNSFTNALIESLQKTDDVEVKVS